VSIRTEHAFERAQANACSRPPQNYLAVRELSQGYRPPGALKGGDVLVRHDCFAAPLPQGLSCWPEYAAPTTEADDPFEAWADDPAPF